MTYETALKIIHATNWAKSSFEDRKTALQVIENHVSKEQNKNSVRIVFKEMPLQEMGAYDFFQSKCITINEKIVDVDNSEIAVKTVLHEGYHAYQDQLVNGVINGNHPHLDFWRDSLNNKYISYAQDPKGYEEQALEKDANKYADEKSMEIQFESECIERGPYAAKLLCLGKSQHQLEDALEKYQATKEQNNWQTR